MATPTLIFCGGKSAIAAEIAVDAGFRYGAQLPCTTYAPVFFADQDWKKPDRDAYMIALAEHTPPVATVLDLEHNEQFAEVMSWAEEASQYAQRVVIIPKIPGVIQRIPHRVGRADVVLGFSVPTRFGGTPIPEWEFRDRMVHLLGGSPHRQIRLYQQMGCYCDIVSVDVNMHFKMATSRGAVWHPGTGTGRDRYWTTLSEADGRPWCGNAPMEAFRRSCVNIAHAWSTLSIKVTSTTHG